MLISYYCNSYGRDCGGAIDGQRPPRYSVVVIITYYYYLTSTLVLAKVTVQFL